jgi:hypothetical protein
MEPSRTPAIVHSFKHLAATAVFITSIPTICAGATICFDPECHSQGLDAWAFEIGASVITNNSIEDFLGSNIERANGPAGGEIYTITASRRIGEFKWRTGGYEFTPQVEVPISLEVVDENSTSPFLNLNTSFAIRWVDFPWNNHIKTTFSMGVGLSYSEQIYRIDVERHPGEYRSKVKFNWPIQLTFARSGFGENSVSIFISHHSGGHVFDVGGFNSLGLGYRHEF